MSAPSPSDPRSPGYARTNSAPETAASAGQPKRSPIFRVLEAVERLGNLLPHPFWLFWVLALILGGISAILAAAGVQVTLPGTDETVAVKSLLSTEGAVMAVQTAMENFAGFAPLPVVGSVILGVAVAGS